MSNSDRNNTQSTRKGLSKSEALALSTLAGSGRNVISISDIAEVMACSKNVAMLLAGRLVKKKWLSRIAQGKYLIIPLEAGAKGIYTEHDFVLASKFADPYYIAYWSALNYYGFTEQVPMTTFVAVSNRLKNREIENSRFKFITIGKRKMFGIIDRRIGANTIRISDKEKTIADCLDHPEYCGGLEEVVKAFRGKSKFSLEKTLAYCKKLGSSAPLKRFGYLLEITNNPFAAAALKALKKDGAGFSKLDTSYDSKGKHNTKWRLIINVDPEKILTE